MKPYIFICLFTLIDLSANAQSIVGKWQLVNQSNCMEDQLDMEASGVEDMVSEMKNSGNITRSVIQFKDNNTGVESVKTLSKKKAYNPNSFFYKVGENALYILDKRSRTIVEGFMIERLTTDSLVLSNAERACETKIFVKIN